MDNARILLAFCPHSGDWFHAAPISTIGLRLSAEAVRVAVSHRLGCKAGKPHTCVCGKDVDARGLHGLSCCKSAPRWSTEIAPGDNSPEITPNEIESGVRVLVPVCKMKFSLGGGNLWGKAV